jgi:thiosulfate/3-mercaptopyruvate sulfurtransferase
MLSTIIQTADLESRLHDETFVVIDCRSKQATEFHGETAYKTEHIAGAVYANLDRDMAAPHVPGETGRHPLPTVDVFAATLSRLGIDASKQVVVYDDMAGAYAARLWWMLRWMGHDAVAVLDGGWQKWVAEGRPSRTGIESNRSTRFVPHVRPQMIADAAEVDSVRLDEACPLIDARNADRFRGENETLDPVAGHIRGAISMPYGGNLTADGVFLSTDELRDRFAEVAKTGAENAVCYCGSGVTAAHNILAMAHADLSGPRLYVGSWSDWITDPGHSIA